MTARDHRSALLGAFALLTFGGCLFRNAEGPRFYRPASVALEEAGAPVDATPTEGVPVRLGSLRSAPFLRERIVWRASPVEAFARLRESLSRPGGRALAQFRFHTAGAYPALEGSVKARAWLTCQRCLQEFEATLESPVRVKLMDPRFAIVPASQRSGTRVAVGVRDGELRRGWANAEGSSQDRRQQEAVVHQPVEFFLRDHPAVGAGSLLRTDASVPAPLADGPGCPVHERRHVFGRVPVFLHLPDLDGLQSLFEGRHPLGQGGECAV